MCINKTATSSAGVSHFTHGGFLLGLAVWRVIWFSALTCE